MRATAGGFDVERYRDEASAREAIEDREVYGAFVATPAGAKVLTASAASPMVAQCSRTPPPSRESTVEDVWRPCRRAAAALAAVGPAARDRRDPHRRGRLAAGVRARPGRAGLMVAGSILAGLVATAIVQSWLDVVEGDWGPTPPALSLTVAAIAATVAGLKALLGDAGIALAALTMVFVGNPFAGVGSAPELLPRPVGGIGQLLPPGAGGEPAAQHRVLRRRRRRNPRRRARRMGARRAVAAARRGAARPQARSRRGSRRAGGGRLTYAGGGRCALSRSPAPGGSGRPGRRPP